FASSAPKIWLGFWSKMRFSAAALADGCAKRTVSPAATSKDCQSIASRSEPCVISVVPAPREIVPEPATISPPSGPAVAAWANSASHSGQRGGKVGAAVQPRLLGQPHRDCLVGAAVQPRLLSPSRLDSRSHKLPREGRREGLRFA